VSQPRKNRDIIENKKDLRKLLSSLNVITCNKVFTGKWDVRAAY
jgi:hypothetical protein